jgi:hypothetical protein
VNKSRTFSRFIVDGKPSANDLFSVAGYINEYIWDEEKANCQITAEGLIVALRNIKPDEEYYVSYGRSSNSRYSTGAEHYDWDPVKITLIKKLAESLDVISKGTIIPNSNLFAEELSSIATYLRSWTADQLPSFRSRKTAINQFNEQIMGFIDGSRHTHPSHMNYFKNSLPLVHLTAGDTATERDCYSWLIKLFYSKPSILHSFHDRVLQPYYPPSLGLPPCRTPQCTWLLPGHVSPSRPFL